MSEKLIVGVYLSLKEAQEAITQLEKHGFPIANVSIVAKEFADENGPSSGVNTSARETESVRDWFAERFSWILESSHFPEYEKHFHARKFLLVADGTQDQIAWAYAIVRETGPVKMDLHDKGETDL